MDTFVKLLIALVLGAGLMVTVPITAQAGWQGCVTKHEYQRVHKGMRIKRVHRIFDTSGRRARGWDGPGPIREYRTCKTLPDGAPGYMISYRQNRRLLGKSHIIMD